MQAGMYTHHFRVEIKMQRIGKAAQLQPAKRATGQGMPVGVPFQQVAGNGDGAKELGAQASTL